MDRALEMTLRYNGIRRLLTTPRLTTPRFSNSRRGAILGSPHFTTPWRGLASSFPEATHIWKNGNLVPWKDANVHVLSTAVQFGSSLFEGIRCYGTPKGPGIVHLRGHHHGWRHLEQGIPEPVGRTHLWYAQHPPVRYAVYRWTPHIYTGASRYIIAPPPPSVYVRAHPPAFLSTL